MRDGANEDAASTGDLDVTDDLAINGAGARAASVVGGPAPFGDRMLEYRPGGLPRADLLRRPFLADESKRGGPHRRWEQRRLTIGASLG